MKFSENDTAVLSNQNPFTCFAFDGQVIRFRTSNHLERYTKIVEWDNGYLVVMAKYDTKSDEVEEYVDMVPILDNLYYDTEKFLKPIKKVRIQNDES